MPVVEIADVGWGSIGVHEKGTKQREGGNRTQLVWAARVRYDPSMELNESQSLPIQFDSQLMEVLVGAVRSRCRKDHRVALTNHDCISPNTHEN